MDKTMKIVITVLVVVLLVLIGAAFIADSKDNYIIKINDVGYAKEGFEDYYRIRYFEEEEANKEANDEEKKDLDPEQIKEDAFTEYTNALLVNQIAAQKGYKPSASITTTIEAKYDAEDFNSDRLTELGITREKYIETEKTIEMANDFYNNLDEYYTISDDTFNEYIEQAKDDMKSYDFRMMQFAFEKDEETGETNKDEVIEKAKGILERVKNGEDFETLAKENATTRLTISGSELKQYNGELESVDKPYLSGYLGNEDLYNALLKLNVGEYTDVISNDSNASFIRLEAVNDGVKDETKEAIRKELGKYEGQLEIYNSTPSVITNKRLLKEVTL